MRVMHIDAGKIFGGVESFLLTLARYRSLCPEMEPEFALCFEGRLAADLAKAGVWVHRLSEVRSRNPLSILRARQKLARLLSGRHVDAVVCHMPWVHAIFGPVVRKFNLPLVFWLHSASTGRHWTERWARLTPPDAAAAPSRFAAATVRNIYPRTEVDIVHYAIPAPPAVTEDDRRALRLAQNTPEGAVVIVQAGRLARFKGYEDHLIALGQLRDDSSWICWIVGGPQHPEEREFLARLKSLASELGISERVRFLGQRSDVPRVLAAADIYCQPNVGTEGLPIIFGEAMYARLPVVTSAIGGFEESVDPSCGILVPPGNPRELAAMLRKLIRDNELRKTMGAQGRKKVVAMADPAVQIPKIYNLLLATTHRVNGGEVLQRKVART